MNLRLACDLCGSQPCMCQEFECIACKGEGWTPEAKPVQHCCGEAEYECGGRGCSGPRTEWEQEQVGCEACQTTGWIKCRTAVPCPHEATQGTCHCEAAWERQQEANASEPPMSAREQHERAWQQKQELRR